MPAAAIGHKAEGTIDSVGTQNGTLSLNHGPVVTLKWPAMAMEFKAAHAAAPTGPAAPLDPATRARLKALGYAD